MKRRMKRIMAFIFVVMFLFTAIPANVYAEEVDGLQSQDVEADKSEDTVEVLPENEAQARMTEESIEVESVEEIPQTSAEGKTRYTVLLLDQSTSMRGLPMTNLKIAAKRFCEQTFQSQGTNYVAIVSYGSSAYERCLFTASYDETATAIDSISVQGSTDITEAILKADELFLYQRPI